MTRALVRLSSLALLAVGVACAPGGGADAGPGADDAGATADAGPDDGGFDAGPTGPLPGFGTIAGMCGVLDDELGDGVPSYFANAIDFANDPWDEADYAALTTGGQEIYDDGNAGGSSLLSEVFAYEVLARCEGATLIKTETEIDYTDDQGTITDLLVEIDGRRIGVSVTRAIAFPFDDPYTVAQAETLLEDKLQGVLDSSANVAAADAWDKQILSVIAYTPDHAAALESAWANVDAALRADTIVYVTASDGADDFLY